MRIFKYTKAEHALKILENLQIKVSAADQLNDPFELSPLFDAADYTLEKCIQFLKRPDQIDYWYAKEGNARGIADRETFKDFYLEAASLRQRAESLLPGVPANIEMARKNFAATFSQQFRLFCASKIRSSILMWSHYANDHKGVVIEFDTERRPFSYLPDYLLPVKYKANKERFCYGNDDKEFKQQLFKVVETKSPHWQHEEEVRFIIPLTRCVDSRFVPLGNSTTIRSITFGCRHMSDGLSAVLREILARLDTPEFKHVAIWDAIESPQKFCLDFSLRRSERL